MSSQDNSVGVSEEAKQLVYDIIAKHNFSKGCEVKYYPGAQVGDGYATNAIAVDIIDGENKLNLFLKCAVNVGNKELVTHMIHVNEIYFYRTIYPTYTAFWKDKGIKDGFQNVPESYGFHDTRGSEIVALENLKKKGFTMFDRFTLMNDKHLKLIFQSFAKFHAISFAMKDQQKALHDEFCELCPNYYGIETIFGKMLCQIAKKLVCQLDAVKDKDILDKCDNISTKIYDQIVHMDTYLTDYSIFTKGDCWVNNMMFLYENGDRERPIDLILIDWQCIRYASPVHDIAAVFYSVASKATVDNYKYYLGIYYDELSERIKELGSDPEVLYPRSVFEKQWVDYGVYAFGFCLMMIKAMLCKPENIPNFDKEMSQDEIENMFANLTDNEEEYLMRAKYIARHLIDIGAL